ncbi:MAG TPA: hypothetical protein PK971_08390, partial [Saprospiraceae bacterium]|nr:hypothetical protein [Saprospiraceae bacterium]
VVLSNFGCGFLSHASAIFLPDALHRTQKSPRLIQKSTTQNSTNYLYRTLSLLPFRSKKVGFRPYFAHISPLFSSDTRHRTPKDGSSGQNPPTFLIRNR